jgi:pimeloyl-ACP methyl ester carboxylesterase
VIRHRYASLPKHRVFYREAGREGQPAVLLLHGFPSSSHMFRNLMPLLADRFHVIAPDLPGSGLTETPGEFDFCQDALADVLAQFADALGLTRHALYLFGSGAAVGLRLALARPARVSAIVIQNASGFEDGADASCGAMRKYWEEPSDANRDSLRSLLTLESTKWQYLHGVCDATRVAPESYLVDHELLSLPGRDEIQLDLFLDYASNAALYPQFQAYLSAARPPLLGLLGRHDPFVRSSAAEALWRDAPAHAELRLYDTGRFVLETHVHAVASALRGFLDHSVPRAGGPVCTRDLQ